MFNMAKTDSLSNEEPRKKRKYTKRAKMLMRSNNDYIDHDYWPKMYAEAKKREKLMREKYPESYARVIQTASVDIASPVVTRMLTKEELKQREIENCTIYGILCSRHNMYHTPLEMPSHK